MSTPELSAYVLCLVQPLAALDVRKFAKRCPRNVLGLFRLVNEVRAISRKQCGHVLDLKRPVEPQTGVQEIRKSNGRQTKIGKHWNAAVFVSHRFPPFVY